MKKGHRSDLMSVYHETPRGQAQRAQTDWLGFCKAWGHMYSMTLWWRHRRKRTQKHAMSLRVTAEHMSWKFTPTISSCLLRVFSSGWDGHPSSSCAHGNHASSCANGCSADTSSSSRSTSPKKSFRNHSSYSFQSKCKRTKTSLLSLLTMLNYSPETT